MVTEKSDLEPRSRIGSITSDKKSDWALLQNLGDSKVTKGLQIDWLATLNWN